MHIASYPKVHNVGHPETGRLFDGPVLIEEKLDGSQFTFGLINGEIVLRSKGAELHADAPEGMFKKAVESVLEIADVLTPGWVYRAEYFQKPKHNTIQYDRIPSRHIAVFDIQTGIETYLSYDDKSFESERLGLEVVPRLWNGVIESKDQLMALLDRESMLGGANIEGVVIKRYDLFTSDGNALICKFVSEAFKEAHRSECKRTSPGKNDIMETLCGDYCRPARWAKAVQHLKEAGQIEGSPRDIGLLIKEAMRDLDEEYRAEIAERLTEWAMPQILRASTRGLAEWYKDQLAAAAFSATED